MILVLLIGFGYWIAQSPNLSTMLTHRLRRRPNIKNICWIAGLGSGRSDFTMCSLPRYIYSGNVKVQSIMSGQVQVYLSTL